MSNIHLSRKYPVLMSILYLLLLSVFSAVPAILAGVLELSEIQTMKVYTGGFAISAATAVLIMFKSSISLTDYGLDGKIINFPRGVLGLLPLVVVSGSILFAGVDSTLSVDYLVAVLLYVLAASINEELYFRGLILGTLRTKGTGLALAVSSMLFGLAHLGSLTAGKSLEHTLLLVLFSALFAFVCAELVVVTGSILVPIAWHFLHNLLSSTTLAATNQVTLAIVGFQCIVMLGYAIYLWRVIKAPTNITIAA